MKVTIVGAGNVGSTIAAALVQKNFCREIVMIDIKKGVAEGKTLDIFQVSPIVMYDTTLKGSTNDYSMSADSDLVVITSGMARKPGMSREDIIITNGEIVKSVAEQVIKYSPNAIMVVVSNPLDAMTYLVMKTTKLPSSKVVGMAGLLDIARYKAFLAMELDCSPRDIEALILGGHGDDMVALKNFTNLSGIPVSQLLTQSRHDAIVRRTRMGGGEIVELLGISAWQAPGYATAEMVEAILLDQKRVIPSSAYLDGEYGYRDIYFGVPVKLGKKGVEKIFEVPLTDEEKDLVSKSAARVKETIDMLRSKGLI